MENFSTASQYYMLILGRMFGLFFTAPIFSTEMVPYRMRIAISLMMAAVLFPVSVNYLGDLPKGPLPFSMAVISQVTIGIIIGFMVNIVFSSFQIAGEIFSVQMGISFSEVLDPQSQVSVPILGTLKNLIGILVFLGVDFYMDGFTGSAYMHMVRALGISFQSIPAFSLDIQTTGGVLRYLDEAFGIMFITALKIGIPIIGIVFISSVALGLLGRAAPQMNLMNMGIQINITVGLLVIITVTPVIVPLMKDAFIIIFMKMGDMFRNWPEVSHVM